MKTFYQSLLSALLLGTSLVPASAATISSISFTSNNGNYINDTIANNGTSPLAFTATTNLAQPFLNAADSTITLGYGSYYAIAFLGFGQHLGAGTVAFLLDGTTLYSQNVTFPDPAFASSVFANFSLPGGDSVKIQATGLSADRIQVVANGGGLTTDGTPDAFYLFDFTSGTQGVPEPATGALAAGGLVTAWILRRRFLRR